MKWKYWSMLSVQMKKLQSRLEHHKTWRVYWKFWNLNAMLQPCICITLILIIIDMKEMFFPGFEVLCNSVYLAPVVASDPRSLTGPLSPTAAKFQQLLHSSPNFNASHKPHSTRRNVLSVVSHYHSLPHLLSLLIWSSAFSISPRACKKQDL